MSKDCRLGRLFALDEKLFRSEELYPEKKLARKVRGQVRLTSFDKWQQQARKLPDELQCNRFGHTGRIAPNLSWV